MRVMHRCACWLELGVVYHWKSRLGRVFGVCCCVSGIHSEEESLVLLCPDTARGVGAVVTMVRRVCVYVCVCVCVCVNMREQLE